MSVSTFIFVHDQQIVLDYIAAGKFSQLPDVKYCFLGQRPVDQIEALDNVIIARNLPDNIEHLPNLVAWTGWYALWWNGYLNSNIVNLFEYDVNIDANWYQPKQETAYFLHASTDEVWWNYGGIRAELSKAIGAKYQSSYMPMTSNYTIHRMSVHTFVLKLSVAIRDGYLNPKHPMAGHIIERICSAHFQGSVYFDTGLKHLYADSHGTQGRGAGYDRVKHQLL